MLHRVIAGIMRPNELGVYLGCVSYKKNLQANEQHY